MSSNRCAPAPDDAAGRQRPSGAPARLALLLATAVTVACNGGIPTPASDLATGQAVMDLGQQLLQLREENAMLQAQIDSLRSAVAAQDSVVRQLAAGAGVPMRPPVLPIP